MPDDIGHGKSSKPSDGMHARFPRYRYRDMGQIQPFCRSIVICPATLPTADLHDAFASSYSRPSGVPRHRGGSS